MTTITFPTLSRGSAKQVEIGLKANTQIFTSPLSGDVQTLELPGTRWTMSFAFEAMERADAALLEAFIAQLRGQANRARVPLWGRSSNQGSWAGSPAVNNEVGSPTLSQTGNSLWLNGFSASATVKAGDVFNLGTAGQLLMITADGTADGGGNLEVSVEPAIRVAPAHGTALVYSDCVVPYMILMDQHFKYQIAPGDFSDYAFDLVEVFA